MPELKLSIISVGSGGGIIIESSRIIWNIRFVYLLLFVILLFSFWLIRESYEIIGFWVVNEIV